MGEQKLQSAIEYLTTYGWAIVVIAIVLATLYYLGFLNPNTYSAKASPNSCYVSRPYGPNTTAYIALSGVCTNEVPEYVGEFIGSSYAVTPDNYALVTNSFTITLCSYLGILCI